ncbi:hypothetical protein Q5424_14635 [Conexibacter sp. JD483]|uniref:TolB family protein n=1 Tax=unclassified Conexibacter TaxID=2627773 RepID=UPI00271F6E53|nr:MULTISPECIES: hypothetical protein [unclassified Conexibacter]MDO8187590.1 hypothetical protein [Conexibacter sp. CPCC 205706]MDO8198956.1 hypothetical protein [Conexibacter sp. CPCC 205762]MDR9370337.1 hypothetical protein [Conexibacter sp. JD483]
MPASLLRRLATAGVAALALAATAPAVASADSILYLRGGDLWLVSSDAASSFQLTATGGWEYGSQSDDGSVIVASRERRLFVLNRNGDVVRELPTVIGSIWWQGPFEPQVSPDGSHVAYQYYTTTTGELQTGTAYADTDGSGQTHELHTGWGYPAWIDNEWLMHSDPPNFLSMDVIIRRLDQPNNQGDQWFRHDELELRDGDIRGTTMAFVGGKDGEYLPVYRFSGAPGENAPEYCYHRSGPSGRFEGPAYSPDGASLAWGEADGIWVGPVGDQSQGCQNPPAGADRLLIPGGRYPDWSGAAVPPARVVDTPREQPRETPRDQPRTTPRTTPRDEPRRAAPKPQLTVTKARLASVLKQGLAVKVRNGSGRVTLTATVSAATARKAGLGRRTVKVASGSATARAGSATVRLRFTKAAVKRLRRLPKVALTIQGAGTRTSATLTR